MMEGIVNPCTIKAVEAIEGCGFESFVERAAKSLGLLKKRETESEGKRPAEWLDKYPPVLHACHVQEILGVSNGKTYEIMRSEGCPTYRDGKSMVVLRDLFWEYLVTSVTGKSKRGDEA